MIIYINLIMEYVEMEDIFSNCKPVSDMSAFYGNNKTPNKKTPSEVFKEGIERQIELVKYDISQKGIKPKGRRWYSSDGKQIASFFLYSVKPVLLKPELMTENPAIIVANNLKELQAFYTKLMKDVDSGKFDSIINKVAADMIAERNATREKNEKDPVFLANKEKRAAKRAEKKAKEEAVAEA